MLASAAPSGSEKIEFYHFPRTLVDTCNVSGYSATMIKSFRHKGLERYFISGSKRGIKPEHALRLKQMLFRLHFAEKIEDVNFPGSDLF